MLEAPGITRRMKVLCANCQWLESNLEACAAIRKGYDCTKYQIKQDIEQLRAKDPVLNKALPQAGSKTLIE